ncbi:hypothetical protein ACIP5Y_41645 [Nocardia sp. NPDC088792]|uniref:hypothetical protein n=1 Tax=Nocardia sp. NPDC088792 TaxID=3364332 RepID=UPI0037F1607B
MTIRRTIGSGIALLAATGLTAAGVAHAAPGAELVTTPSAESAATPVLRLTAAQNLVVNPAFADGGNGWGVHLYNADLNNGSASVHDSGYVGQDVPVTKGAEYTFSVQVSAADGGGVLALALDSVSNNAYVSQTVNSTAPTAISQTFTAQGAKVYIACQATAGPGGTCTDFSVTPTGRTAGTGSASGSAGSSTGTGSFGSS